MCIVVVQVQFDHSVSQVYLPLNLQFSRRQLLASMQESPHFVAPEIVLGNAENITEPAKVDVWSAGIVLYAMLCGKLPFIHPQMKTLCKLIVASPLVAPDCTSDECIELLQGMLEKQSEQRMSMDDVLRCERYVNI